jgi:Zn-finger nucleic acid-binding protein
MQKYEVDIDYCPHCKSVLLDKGEMDKIVNIQGRYDDEDTHYQKYHYGRRDYDYNDDDDDNYCNNERRRKRGLLDNIFLILIKKNFIL